jgi:hypothetical protein
MCGLEVYKILFKKKKHKRMFLGKSKCRCKDNTKIDLIKKQRVRVWSGFKLFRTGSNVGLLSTRKLTFGFLIRRDILNQLSNYRLLYKDSWLWAGRTTSRSSSPGRINIFLLSTLSRPVLAPTQHRIQWDRGLSPRR